MAAFGAWFCTARLPFYLTAAMPDVLTDGLTWLLALVHAGLWGLLAGNLRYLRQHTRRRPLAAPPALSVLIPARNEAENLQRLLPSLLAQDHPSFEVIVYDDASDDGTGAVLDAMGDARLTTLRGDEPPPGWIGKVHALYRATRRASGTHYLFLDADAALHDPGALRRLAERFAALPDRSVLTGFPCLCGRAPLLVSLVPNVLLVALPWPLVRHVRTPALSALNGQCWMIRAADYHRHEPHRTLPGAVLEDVEIGRYLKAEGLTPVLVDVQREVAVHMYAGFRAAWHGFRKNAYLILGGTPIRFVALFACYALAFVLAPLFSPWLLLSVYGLKAATDYRSGFAGWVAALAPLSYLLGSVLQLDSALSHWRGRVAWKGRRLHT